MKRRVARDVAAIVLAKPETGPRPRIRGKKHPDQWAKFVWEIMATQGQLLTKDAKFIDNADEHISEPTLQAERLQQK